MNAKPPYARAVWMVVLAGAFLSTAGVGIRLMDNATGLQIVFYRSIAMSLFLAAFLLFRHRGRLLGVVADVGPNGLLAAVFYATASVAFVYAILYTSVANVMFIISLAPVLAALLGRAVLGERVPARTWVAIAFATSGVLVMVSGGLSTEGFLGIALAFTMALNYAAFTVTLRRGASGDMLPAACLAGFLVSAVCGALLFATASFSLSANDLWICVGLGIFQTGLGTLLMVLGSRHVPAAQIAFLAMLEVVLSPIWVWLVVDEQPAAASLLGGSVIVGAILYQARGALPQRAG